MFERKFSDEQLKWGIEFIKTYRASDIDGQRMYVDVLESLLRAHNEIERQRAVIARQRDMFNESSENEEIRLRKENERQRALIDHYVSWLKAIRDNHDCECVVGTRTVGAVWCVSCQAKKALEDASGGVNGASR